MLLNKMHAALKWYLLLMCLSTWNVFHFHHLHLPMTFSTSVTINFRTVVVSFPFSAAIINKRWDLCICFPHWLINLYPQSSPHNQWPGQLALVITSFWKSFWFVTSACIGIFITCFVLSCPFFLRTLVTLWHHIHCSTLNRAADFHQFCSEAKALQQVGSPLAAASIGSRSHLTHFVFFLFLWAKCHVFMAQSDIQLTWSRGTLPGRGAPYWAHTNHRPLGWTCNAAGQSCWTPATSPQNQWTEPDKKRALHII